MKKEFGDTGVLASKKDFEDHKKREAAKPKPKAKPDTRSPEQKKNDQDHANVMARYGGEENYKAGRGLGT